MDDKKMAIRSPSNIPWKKRASAGDENEVAEKRRGSSQGLLKSYYLIHYRSSHLVYKKLWIFT